MSYIVQSTSYFFLFFIYLFTVETFALYNIE